MIDRNASTEYSHSAGQTCCGIKMQKSSTGEQKSCKFECGIETHLSPVNLDRMFIMTMKIIVWQTIRHLIAKSTRCTNTKQIECEKKHGITKMRDLINFNRCQFANRNNK